jgi:hypothetical protein
MKGFVRAVAAICAAVCLPASVSAAKVTVKAKGVVGQIRAYDYALLSYIPLPPASIETGDEFSFSMKFDTSLAWSDPTFSADPAVAVYVMPGTATLRIGGYMDDFSVGWTQATVGLLDNAPVSEDAQHFEFIRFGAPQSSLPVEMGSGYLTQGVYLHTYDWTATARDSDLITDLKPLSLFPEQQFITTFINDEAHLIVTVDGAVTESSIAVRAVPEPASWAMMLGGFGAIGGAMRSRKRMFVRFA